MRKAEIWTQALIDNQKQNEYLAPGKNMTNYLLLTCNTEQRIGEDSIILFSQSKALTRPPHIHEKMEPQA